MASGRVRVVHGANDAEFDGLVGKSIRSVYKALESAFSLRANVQALVNGRPVPGDYLIQPEDDVLEFAPTGWGRKGALDPDELERLIRSIYSDGKKNRRLLKKLIAGRLSLPLRLNQKEVEIIKVL